MKTRKITTSVLLSIITISMISGILLPNIAKNQAASFNNEGKIIPSLISGDDVYSEQIQAFLAGNNALIRQSAITNDNYTLNQLPLDDTAFENATTILFSSNGKKPVGYSDLHVPFNELVTFEVPVNGIFLYISYNVSTNIEKRAARAKSLIQDAIGIELLEINDGYSTQFTYYGVQPNWKRMVDLITLQLPNDGYFSYLDKGRITSTSYMNSKHLSAGFISIDPDGGEISDIAAAGGILDIFNQLDFNSSELEGFLGLDFDEEDVNVLGGKTNIAFVQYEGDSSGISYNAGEYEFDLKKALGVDESVVLKPSRSIWNSLFSLDPTGVLTTLIDVSVLTGNVKDWNVIQNGVHNNLTIDDEILDTIYLASGLLGGQGFNIIEVLDALEFVVDNLYMITHWEKTGAASRLYSNINMTREGYDQLLADFGLPEWLLDFILDEIIFDTSPLDLVGFQGLPYIPSGLLKPIENYTVTYEIINNQPQPIIIANHETDLAVKPYDEIINLDLNLTNVGSDWAYGVKIGHGNLNIQDLLGTLPSIGIDYEIRAFYIPSLAPLGFGYAVYGFENYLFIPTATQVFTLGLAGISDDNGDGYYDAVEMGIIDPGEPVPSLAPNGGSVLIDLSELVATSFYIGFENETANFTSVSLLNGTEILPATENNDTLAESIDGETWDIESNGTGENNNITIQFSFENETSNVNATEIEALEFTYQGFNNDTIWENGTAEFFIYNFNTSLWVPLNNLTRNSIFINQTSPITGFDQFRIYKGDNDTENNTIDLLDYMNESANFSVLLQLRLLNNVSTLLEVDYMGMNYLQRNDTTTRIPPRRVTYTDSSSITRRNALSDALYVSSLNTSSLLVEQHIENSADHTTGPGQSRDVVINIYNVLNASTARVFLLSSATLIVFLSKISVIPTPIIFSILFIINK